MINFEELSILIDEGDMDDDNIRNLVCELVRTENWFPIYCLSELVAREVSILVDAENNVWIDCSSRTINLNFLIFLNNFSLLVFNE